MRKPIHIAQCALAAGVGAVCLFVSDNWSSQQSSLVTQADARVGRPLTPVSVAGVARRQTRRAVRHGAYYYGAAAVGTGAAAAYYGSRYAGGTPYSYTGGSPYYTNADRAYDTGTFAGGVYRPAGAGDRYYATAGTAPRNYAGYGYYPTRAIVSRGNVPVYSYYGPLCRPGIDIGCQ
jgi:hypothetical protein